MNIAVIGAGASGITAALHAAWKGAQVTLFERNATIGRKLLVTGSGRCNITNDSVAGSKYSCADLSWMNALLEHFGVRDLIGMLDEIGIPVQKTSDGWYYPLSNSAQAVVDAFSNALSMAGVKMRYLSQVVSIQTSETGFTLTSTGESDERLIFDRVIVAAGGMAYPTLGSRGELFPVLQQLGHTLLPKRPALAPVLADLGALKALQGIRLDVGVTLWGENTRIGFAAGNLIFTQWGLNGPAVMDISHHISAYPETKMRLSLNLLEFCLNEFDGLLIRKRYTALPLIVFLEAFFQPKVGRLFIKMCHLPSDIRLNQVDDNGLKDLINRLKDTSVAVRGVRGFEYCQISAGGIPVFEVFPQTMESHLIKGLYLTGETLDVVGPCGGYNLQYAFSSGAVAGLAATKTRNYT